MVLVLLLFTLLVLLLGLLALRLLGLAAAGTLDGGGELVDNFVEGLDFGVDGLQVVTSLLLVGGLDSSQQLVSDLLRDLGAVLLEGSLAVVDGGVKGVLSVDDFLGLGGDLTLFFLSWSFISSPCLTSLSISDLVRPPLGWMVMVWSLPVPLSFAVTFRIPLLSISKVTSI